MSSRQQPYTRDSYNSQYGDAADYHSYWKPKGTFSGKRMLITGATKGIGKQIAVDAVKNGAFVICVGRNKDELKSLKEELDKYSSISYSSHSYSSLSNSSNSNNCLMIEANLADPKSCLQVALEAGHVDYLVNCAGIARNAPFLEQTLDMFDDTFNINIRSVFYLSTLVARGMVSRKYGSIVNVSSQASSTALENHAVYCASKGALDQLTRVMAMELGKHGVRTNAVNPTVVLTEMGIKEWGDPKKAEPMLRKIPLGRFAHPEDVSSVVLFLLSDQASMVNGVCLPIDGGFLASRL